MSAGLDQVIGGVVTTGFTVPLTARDLLTLLWRASARVRLPLTLAVAEARMRAYTVALERVPLPSGALAVISLRVRPVPPAEAAHRKGRIGRRAPADADCLVVKSIGNAGRKRGWGDPQSRVHRKGRGRGRGVGGRAVGEDGTVLIAVHGQRSPGNG